MIKSFVELFQQQFEPIFKADQSQPVEHTLRMATAALLVEIAMADHVFDVAEQKVLESVLQKVYGLSAKETRELVRIAKEEVEHSISLDQFTKLLDRNLNPAQKFHVMELLWKVAFADGRIDKYEEYLVRKLSDLLHVPHKEFIRAKLKVASQNSKAGLA